MKININFTISHDYNDIDVPDNYDISKDPDGIIADFLDCLIDDITNGYIEIKKEIF